MIKSLAVKIKLLRRGAKKGEIITAKFRIIRQFLNSCCNVSELTAWVSLCSLKNKIHGQQAACTALPENCEHSCFKLVVVHYATQI